MRVLLSVPDPVCSFRMCHWIISSHNNHWDDLLLYAFIVVFILQILEFDLIINLIAASHLSVERCRSEKISPQISRKRL